MPLWHDPRSKGSARPNRGPQCQTWRADVSDARRPLDARRYGGSRSFVPRRRDHRTAAWRFEDTQAQGRRQRGYAVRIEGRDRAARVSNRRERRSQIVLARPGRRLRQDVFGRLEQRRRRQHAGSSVIAKGSPRRACRPRARPHREANAREEESSKNTAERHGAAVWIALGPSGKLSSRRTQASGLSGLRQGLRPRRWRAEASDPGRSRPTRSSTSALLRWRGNLSPGSGVRVRRANR
jgi:hypothetical protein